MRKGLALGVVLGLIGFLYFTGRMDPLLYRVGLNYTSCGQNAFGAVYCGSNLTAYDQRVRSLAVHPISPLPGATTAEVQTYQAAMRTYCDDDPQGQGCP